MRRTALAAGASRHQAQAPQKTARPALPQTQAAEAAAAVGRGAPPTPCPEAAVGPRDAKGLADSLSSARRAWYLRAGRYATWTPGSSMQDRSCHSPQQLVDAAASTAAWVSYRPWAPRKARPRRWRLATVAMAHHVHSTHYCPGQHAASVASHASTHRW